MFIRHYDLLFPVIRESNIETNTNNTQSKHSADVFCTVIPNMKLFLTNTLTMQLTGTFYNMNTMSYMTCTYIKSFQTVGKQHELDGRILLSQLFCSLVQATSHCRMSHSESMTMNLINTRLSTYAELVDRGLFNQYTYELSHTDIPNTKLFLT